MCSDFSLNNIIVVCTVTHIYTGTKLFFVAFRKHAKYARKFFAYFASDNLPLLTMSTLSELRILDEVAVGGGSSDCSSLSELFEREQEEYSTSSVLETFLGLQGKV